MRIVTAAEVARLFSMKDALAAAKAAAVLHTAGQAETPARLQLATSEPEGEFLVMPGVVAGSGGSLFGLKLWHRLDAGFGALPQSSASILLLDPAAGEEVLLDGEIITDLRTGALTGVAAAYLAPAARQAAVIGAGAQARTQVLALAEALPSLRQVRVFARTASRLESFAQAMASELGGTDVSVEAVSSARSAVAGADVVVAATTSPTPVIADAWIKPGALVCGVGSHDPASSELEAATVARAELVVVDTKRGGIDGAGDIAGPIKDGALSRDDVVELGALVSGPPRRATPAGVTVFKSVGFATADVVAASLVAARAREQDAGVEIDLHSPRRHLGAEGVSALSGQDTKGR